MWLHGMISENYVNQGTVIQVSFSPWSTSDIKGISLKLLQIHTSNKF